jgi:hypothetical protein
VEVDNTAGIEAKEEGTYLGSFQLSLFNSILGFPL